MSWFCFFLFEERCVECVAPLKPLYVAVRREEMSDAHTLDKSHDTYPDTVLQGRSLSLLERSVVRRVSQTTITIESKGFDAASRS